MIEPIENELPDNKALMAKKFLAAIDLMEFSIALMRQNIVRKLNPTSKENIDRELKRWLFEQPENFVPRIDQ